MIKVIHILLFPFSLLYGLVQYCRNLYFDKGWVKATKFDFPVISVGNLTMGGVGKTPHVEYLIRLLKSSNNIATLSRGYKRKTKGFVLSNSNSTVNEIGDEPLQYKLKFSEIEVAVDEKRVHGIKKLTEICPDLNIVLLDDAYQHRSIKPGINILITDSTRLYIHDNVFPSGQLREWSCGSDRADIIIVSKTGNVLSPIEKRRLKESLKPKPHQKIYFSYVEYAVVSPFTDAAKKIADEVNSNYSVLLLTGIAKPSPLFYKLNSAYKTVKHIKFSDHHQFSNTDIVKIKEHYSNLFGNNKIIITTEKDLMRLSLPKILKQIQDIPIFYIPIEICFHGNDKEEFDNQILNYVNTNSGN